MAKAIRFAKGKVIAGRFEIEEVLDESTSCVSYRAADTERGQPCVLRLVDSEASWVPPDLPEHERIAPIVASGVDAEHGVAYAAHAPFGEPLRPWVKKHALLNKNVLHGVFEQVGEALDAAHGAGVVHGTLSSACVFVDEGNVRLVDFGLASVPGTTARSAPEQHGESLRELAKEKGLRIASEVSPATDVFAFALLAYEVLTDSDIRDYWGKRDAGDLMTKIVMEPREKPSDRAGLNSMNLPDGFDAWFARCTAHDASERIASVGEAATLLVRMMKGEKVEFVAPRAEKPAVAATLAQSPAPAAKGATAVMDPVDGGKGSTAVMAPLATSGVAQTLKAQPPQGLAWEGHNVTGPPHAPPPQVPPPGASPGSPAPKGSSAAIYAVVGGLVALIALIGGGGFLAYRTLVAENDTESTESYDDDDDGRGTRRRPRPPAPPTPAPAGHDTAAVPVRPDDPSWGHADAPVTIVEYSDYQCPYCKRVEPTLTALRTKYGEDKLRVVWKDFPLPFHKEARPAHVAARAVFELGGTKAFWRFHELAFNNQKSLTTTNFEVWSTTAGVSLTKFQRLVADPKMDARIEQNIADGKAVGVKGTPAFFINGKFLSGARPQSAFETEIDTELAEASKLLATGTPKSQIYIERSKANFAAPAPSPSSKPAPDTTTVWKVPVHKDDPYRGNRDALVTIVQFSEFQCPFCAKVEPTLKKLLTDYGSKLRVVWKDNPLPFHKRAVPAALVAREIYAQQGNKGFWAIHDQLFANQKSLEDADLWGYALTVGADVPKVKQAVQKKKNEKIIARSQDEAADFKASGTPHFFINGRRLTGAQPETAFKTIIDEEIIRAGKLLAAGTSASDLYDELIKSGKGPDPLERKSVGAPPADAPFKGGKSAKVVIHEFSDFQCPFCGRVNTTLATILSTYGDKVKIVWRHKPLPFHKDAPLAHEAAVEAYVQQGNAGFWKMHDKLFANQKALKRADLEKYAAEIGLDMTKFRAALNDRRHQARVQADDRASTAVGIRGTPGFVINGYYVSGAQPFSKFRKVIDKALSEVP